MFNRRLIDAAEREAAERVKAREIEETARRSRTVAYGIARGVSGRIFGTVQELLQRGVQARRLDVHPRHAASPEHLRLAASGIEVEGFGRCTVGVLAQLRTDASVSVSVRTDPARRRFSLIPAVELAEPRPLPRYIHVNGRTVQYAESRWELPAEASEEQYNEVGRELVNIILGTGLGLRLVD